MWILQQSYLANKARKVVVSAVRPKAKSPRLYGRDILVMDEVTAGIIYATAGSVRYSGTINYKDMLTMFPLCVPIICAFKAN